MLWMAFGRPVDITDRRGRTRTVNEYAIHVQCTWRFSKNGTILLGSNDMYHPNDKKNEKNLDWQWDLIDRDDSEKSVFDIKAAEINNAILPVAVHGIDFRENGDLSLEFENGIKFDVIVYSSIKKEFWRFIHFRENEKSNHMVIFED